MLTISDTSIGVICLHCKTWIPIWWIYKPYKLYSTTAIYGVNVTLDCPHCDPEYHDEASKYEVPNNPRIR